MIEIISFPLGLGSDRIPIQLQSKVIARFQSLHLPTSPYSIIIPLTINFSNYALRDICSISYAHFIMMLVLIIVIINMDFVCVNSIRISIGHVGSSKSYGWIHIEVVCIYDDCRCTVYKTKSIQCFCLCSKYLMMSR